MRSSKAAAFDFGSTALELLPNCSPVAIQGALDIVPRPAMDALVHGAL